MWPGCLLGLLLWEGGSAGAGPMHPPQLGSRLQGKIQLSGRGSPSAGLSVGHSDGPVRQEDMGRRWELLVQPPERLRPGRLAPVSQQAKPGTGELVLSGNDEAASGSLCAEPCRTG